ncbi:glutathione S-transferase family protein [Sulfitobacter sp. HNIBRBA3233]|uniref:glutathione S-transferase family protein n=1 Tax=Sulfitobacter marinivivus TaxID=3158558 RepID=UPI0032E01267
MAERLTLTGYRYSVYTRIVRIALIEMGLSATYAEVDPFTDPPDPRLLALNPMAQVPVLRDGEFVLTQTAAILRHLQRISGAPVVPDGARAQARMDQVIGLLDTSGYLPMVREVFDAAVFAAFEGRASDPQRIAEGCAAAAPVLEVLEAITAEGLVLTGRMTLADMYLLPMLACFTAAPEGYAAVQNYPALARYWQRRCARPSLVATDPFGKG